VQAKYAAEIALRAAAKAAKKTTEQHHSAIVVRAHRPVLYRHMLTFPSTPLHATQATKTNKYCFLQKDTQPKQACPGEHSAPNPSIIDAGDASLLMKSIH
jgi:hypothetical protein